MSRRVNTSVGRRWLILFVTLGLLLTVVVASAEDWPCWRGPRG